MKAPAFQFYPGDFLSSPDVQIMEAHEVGAYLLLLCAAWQSERPGYLPNDEGRLRRLARLSADQWGESGPLLLNKFPPVENGAFRANPRLLLEAAKQEQRRERLAANGQKGGRPKNQTETKEKATENLQVSERNQKVSDSGATGLLSSSSSTSSSTSSSEQPSPLRSEEVAAAAAPGGPEKKIGEEGIEPSPLTAPPQASHTGGAGREHSNTKSKVAKPAEPEHFAAFWEAYPRKEKRHAAARAFAQLPAADQAAARARLAAWLAARPDLADPARLCYVPHPTSWLNGKRWTDAAPTSTPQAHALPRQPVAYAGANPHGAAARLQTPLPDAASPNPWGLPGRG